VKSIPTNSPNNVASVDEPGPGGAHHAYAIQGLSPSTWTIQFQRGARGVDGSVPGIFEDDLLAIIQDRMEKFQAGPYSSQHNSDCLTAIIAAREALGRRVAERIARGVLGKEVK